ncbi:hypothetical protein Nepgr_016916 [Nepenthes gracilis]|uniref:MLO-like protein n=1 Tax=Nepenthes gracilis TaxID=150966 RepID=A0AAD3XSX7_NEPGR|nr:hypothetical protein Nepgr_016916 [Nepenthes gracilis]
MNIVSVGTDAQGSINMEDWRRATEANKDNRSTLMVTYPSTHGIYEDGIDENCKIIHGSGSKLTTFQLVKSLILTTWGNILSPAFLAMLYSLASYVGPYLIVTLDHYPDECGGSRTFEINMLKGNKSMFISKVLRWSFNNVIHTCAQTQNSWLAEQLILQTLLFYHDDAIAPLRFGAIKLAQTLPTAEAANTHQRAINRLGKGLQKTKRKAITASVEKIKEELMLLDLISLMLGQCARWISEMCVDSSLFNSRFYPCSQEDFGIHENFLLGKFLLLADENEIPPRGLFNPLSHQGGEGHELFVSYEDLEQLHRFLFVLGITHVLYSCLAVGLTMIKIYSWRKWEYQASALAADGKLQVRRNKMMRQQNTFAFHHASHPWSRNRVLIRMFCFLQKFKSSIWKSDYLALPLGFVTTHELPLSYNSHKHMVRNMEDEFPTIVGISWPLGGYAILCIFPNIHEKAGRRREEGTETNLITIYGGRRIEIESSESSSPSVASRSLAEIAPVTNHR